MRLKLKLLVLIISIAFFYSSCDVSSSDSSSTDIQVTAKPAEGGSVESSGNQLSAIPNQGYIFQYWQINYSDGTLNTLIDDSVTVENKNIKNVTGVFGSTDLEIPTHLQVGPYGQYVYFINHFTIPVDSSISKRVSAFVKADTHTLEKQKVYISDSPVRFFDVSYDGNFIAFSRYNNDSYDTYVLNVDGQDVEYYGIGLRPIFSNNSYDFLRLWDTGACIQRLYSNGCRTLDIANANVNTPSNNWAASWSPNDQKIAFSRSTDEFSLFDTETVDRQRITTNTPKEYFEWLDNNTFLSSGASNSNKREVLQYSLNKLNSPQTLSFFTVFAPNFSPSSSRLAYINQGINIFSREDNSTTNILNYVEWDPYLPQWIDGRNIVFYDRNTGKPFILRTSGEVVQI